MPRPAKRRRCRPAASFTRLLWPPSHRDDPRSTSAKRAIASAEMRSRRVASPVAASRLKQLGRSRDGFAPRLAARPARISWPQFAGSRAHADEAEPPYLPR